MSGVAAAIAVAARRVRDAVNLTGELEPHFRAIAFVFTAFDFYPGIDDQLRQEIVKAALHLEERP